MINTQQFYNPFRFACDAEFFVETIMVFFKNIMSLVFNLTSKRISSHMWQTLPLLYDLFNKDKQNTVYFTGVQLG